jgi:hypothetical protein
MAAVFPQHQEIKSRSTANIGQTPMLHYRRKTRTRERIHCMQQYGTCIAAGEAKR